MSVEPKYVRCITPFSPGSRLPDASVNMLVCLLSIVSFQPVLRTAPATGRVARTAISMQLPDFGKSLQGMMPGGGGDDSGLSKEQAEEMEARMKTGGMTFDDFLMQTKVMQKAGAPLAVESGLHHAGCAWAAPHFPCQRRRHTSMLKTKRRLRIAFDW